MLYENVDISRIYTSPDFPLGAKYRNESNGKEYEFVKYNQGDGGVTPTVGQLAYLCGSGGTIVTHPVVTADVNSTELVVSTYGTAYGVFCSVLTDGNYGWIQKKGLSDEIGLTDGNVTSGTYLTPHTTEGAFVSVAAGTAKTPFIGYALRADSGTAMPVGGVYWDFPG
jgi:hypothetical protein